VSGDGLRNIEDGNLTLCFRIDWLEKQ
jgi:hypothetical protein